MIKYRFVWQLANIYTGVCVTAVYFVLALYRNKLKRFIWQATLILGVLLKVISRPILLWGLFLAIRSIDLPLVINHKHF